MNQIECNSLQKPRLNTIPLVLSAFVPREELYLYLSVTEQALSSILVRDDGGVYWPVYYMSHVLYGAK